MEPQLKVVSNLKN